MKSVRLLPWAAAALALTAAPAVAEDSHPITVTQQGFLLDGNDQPVTSGALEFRFRLYNFQNSGDSQERLVWESDACQLELKNGRYSTVLGASCKGQVPLTVAHFPPNEQRYLEISVAGARMLPRMAIAAVPVAGYAFKSADTDALTQALASPGTINSAGNPVDWTRLKGVPTGLAGSKIDADTFAGRPLTDFSSAGSINDPGNAIDWTRLKGVPAGFADGKDDSLIYDAAPGGGLTLADLKFAIANDGTALGRVSAGKLSIDGSGNLALTPGVNLTGVDAARLGGKTLAELQQQFSQSPTISGSLAVSSSVKLGDDTRACDASLAGSVRWNGANLQLCNGSSWRQVDGAPGPTISSASPATGPANGGTAVTLTGTGFAPGAYVLVDGIGALSVTVVNDTKITFTTRPNSSGSAVEVRVVNPDGKSSTLSGGFTFQGITGITPNRGNGGGGTPITMTGTGFVAGMTATIGGQPVTSITVVNSTTMTGIAPAGSGSGRDVVVTSPAGWTSTLPGAFGFLAPLTFTTCGQTGRTGPSQGQCNNAYGTSPVVTVSNGIQQWTVPETGTYVITAAGAAGATSTGAGSLTGGAGMTLRGEFNLNQGEVLKILVGQMGQSSQNPHGNENGGGGGTYVVKADNSPLIIAGGGGGAPATGYGTSCTRTSGDGQFGTAGRTINCYGTGNGGTGGNGGQVYQNGGGYTGAGGGGYSTAGQDAANGHCGNPARGGQSFLAGGVGGNNDGECYSGNSSGGFGGGGAGALGTPGGGGGYSGGGVAGLWSSYSDFGGGGGSFSSGANTTQGSLNSTHGRVDIRLK